MLFATGIPGSYRAAFCHDLPIPPGREDRVARRVGRAILTAVLFMIGKFVLGLYLGSGAAGSAYGAASSLITLLLWIYYAAQIVLFGAEFTQVYTNTYGSYIAPEGHAVRVEKTEIEVPVSRS